MAKEQKGGDTSAVLILSDWLSAIGISHTGNVKSVRSTDFGFGLLAQAITRAARPPTPAQGTAPPTGDSAQDRALGTVNTGVSYRLLFDIGIPRRGQPIASDFNLQADNILPLMQPVVQRYVIETRQTLRFTFDEATISRTVVRIAGAGTRIPGIAKALENQLEIAVEQLDATATDSETELLGEFADAIDRGFALLPRSEVARRMHSRLTKATWRGAAAAGVTLTCLGAILIADRTSVERRFGDLQSRLDSKERHDALKQQAADLSTTIASAQGVLNLAFGERVGWKAMLADLSQLAGEDVRLTEVAGKTSTPDRPGCSLTLRGMTTSTHTAQSSPAPADTKDPLARLIQRLSASPLVADVQVLSSRSGNGEDLTQQVFELLVQLRSLPPLNPADRVAAANEASTPGRGTP
jgi:Tfp pilus assembly protein PilN